MSHSKIQSWFWIGPLAPLDAEQDTAFRTEIKRLTVTGMRVAGLLAVFGPLFAITMNLALLQKTFIFWGPVSSGVVTIAAETFIIILGALTLLASLLPLGARFGRLIVCVAMALMFLGSVADSIASGIAEAAPLDSGIVFIMLMLVATGSMPLRYWQTLALGASLATVYFISIYTLPQMLNTPALVFHGEAGIFMSMITLFGAVISAQIYSSHYRLSQLRQKTAMSEYKYRSIFEDSTDAIFVLDNSTSKFIEVNYAFEELANRSAEEIYALDFMELVAPEDRRLVAENKLKRERGEDVLWRYPIRILQKDSESLVVCDLTVHKGIDPRYTVGALRDITGEVRAKERAEKLAQIPQENPNPVIRSDYDGNITYMNPSAKNLTASLGISDTPVEELLPEDFLESVRESIDTGETLMFQLHRTHDHTFSVTYNPHSPAREAYVWMLDVTERVKAFEKIRSYAEELESKNREIQDTRTQLVQSEKMAALGNLVAGVAHEINTPLGAINSNVDVSERALQTVSRLVSAEGASLPEDVRMKATRTLEALGEITKTMRMAIDRIVGIVRSLKNFARLDESERKRADIHEGIESTLTLLTHELKNRITVVKNFGELPPVDCYPNRLNQVFMNVLVNSAQAISGKGTITITTDIEDGMAKIEFTDTGGGISEEDVKRVFDPGFTTKGVGVGTGLGLSIVYRIVQEHDGTIGVTSEKGKGTTVTIRIPVA